MPPPEIKCQDCFSIEEKRWILKMFLDAIVNDDLWNARDITGDNIPETFCNKAVILISRGLGCMSFHTNSLLANEIMDILLESQDWKEESGFGAFQHAWHGGLALAGSKMLPHGHVAAIYPDKMLYSDSLKKDVPQVANIGKTRGVGAVSRFFPVSSGEPRYFIWPNTRS